ncbi:MAG: hypothetical protein GXX90_08300 [Microbacteriaceae bacterium]|nr:hypothetical protein [Microbacteriaceae bacterium]
MPAVMLVAWTLFTAAVLAAHAHPTRDHRAVDDRELERRADRVGLPLPFELRGAIAERGARREGAVRAVAWGGFVIAVALGAAVHVLGRDRGDGLAGPIVFAVSMLALAAGRVIVAWRQRPALVAGAPPAARERGLEPADYSTQAEETGAWAALGVMLIAPAVAWMTLEVVPGDSAAAGTAAIAALVGAALALVAWALLRGAETRIAHRPQFAHDDVELAWDDADRSGAIRLLRRTMAAVALVPAALLALVVLELAPAVGELDGLERNAAFWTLVWAGALAVVCAIGPYLFLAAGRRNLNPSLRLWRGTDFGSDPR